MYKEKEIEAYFRRKIRLIGGLALKFTPVGFTGVPDRLVIGKGKMFFVEFKKEGGRLSARQEYVIKQLRDLGVKVLVIDSIKMCDDVLSTL